mgnify:CR=1 FL=1
MLYIAYIVPSSNRVHTFDDTTIAILDLIPKSKKSEFVREAIIEKHQNKLNQIKAGQPIPVPTVQIM